MSVYLAAHIFCTLLITGAYTNIYLIKKAREERFSPTSNNLDFDLIQYHLFGRYIINERVNIYHNGKLIKAKKKKKKNKENEKEEEEEEEEEEERKGG
jgi:hypothetical protein